jgi:hypothetical protein
VIVHAIRKSAGIAGQFSVTADVEYPGEPRRALTFVGSTYGGPVVMQTAGMETFVREPGRFGKFGTDWVRRFLDAA